MYFYSTLLRLPPFRFHRVRGMLGLNPGLLELTVRLSNRSKDLISFFLVTLSTFSE
jgi:hypothetical protein